MLLDATMLNEKFTPARQALLVYGREAGFSAVATATAMYLWLRSLGKNVQIVSPASPIVDFSNLVGINKVKTILAGKNMVLQLPLPASKIDKVISDLNQERDVLNLIIKPKNTAGSTAFSSVPVSYQPPDYDLRVFIDVRDASDLASLSNVEESYWTDTSRNIVWHDYATPLVIPASVEITLGKDDTYAAVWTNFCRQNGLEIDADQASNLLMALERDSEHFASGHSTAETFELAAWLLRRGATRYAPDEQAQQAFRPENHLPHLRPNQTEMVIQTNGVTS